MNRYLGTVCTFFVLVWVIASCKDAAADAAGTDIGRAGDTVENIAEDDNMSSKGDADTDPDANTDSDINTDIDTNGDTAMDTASDTSTDKDIGIDSNNESEGDTVQCIFKCGRCESGTCCDGLTCKYDGWTWESFCMPPKPTDSAYPDYADSCDITTQDDCETIGDWCMDGGGTYTCGCDNLWSYISLTK